MAFCFCLAYIGCVYYRFYIPSDFDALYSLEEICYQPPLRFSREYMQELVDNPDSATWIVEKGAALVGFGIVEWYIGDENGEKIEEDNKDGKKKKDGKKMAYLHTVEVLPSLRGLGVGNELMRRLEEAAREAEAEEMWLHVDPENTGAIELYKGHGFVWEGTKADYYGPGHAGLIHRKRFGESAAAEGLVNVNPL